MWRWINCNWTRTQKPLVLKRIISWICWIGWVFVQKLAGSGFESSCSHFIFRFRACFEQGVPWQSDNYRVWVHSESAYVTWQERTVKCTLEINNQNTAQSFGQFAQMVECSFKNEVVLGSRPVAVTLPSDSAPASTKEFLDNQATREFGFTLKMRTWHDDNIQSNALYR